VTVGDEGRTVRDGELALLGAGDVARLRGGSQPGRLLLLAGVPLRERVARYGPFVMNTEEEIAQAVRDYQSGKMGEITRTAQSS
jgi:quercetin 2,3-dioxygenase